MNKQHWFQPSKKQRYHIELLYYANQYRKKKLQKKAENYRPICKSLKNGKKKHWQNTHRTKNRTNNYAKNYDNRTFIYYETIGFIIL